MLSRTPPPNIVPHRRNSPYAPAHAFPVLALLLLSITGCGLNEPLSAKLRPDVIRPNPGVLILLVDGLPPRIVEQGCQQGWLPNISKYFHAGGTRVQHATTCVPSITYAAIATLSTGVGPDRHGIIGNQWFDPHDRLFRSYMTIPTYDLVDNDYDAPLLYEMIQPHDSAVIQAVHRRGAGRIYRNWAISGTLWYFQKYSTVDKLSATTLNTIAIRANMRGQWPDAIMCYMPGLDSVGHTFGVSSPEFHDATLVIDHQVGRIFDWLHTQHLADTTCVILVSDHGMVDVDHHINLVRHMKDHWDRRITSEPMHNENPQTRQAHFDNFDLILSAGDGRRASIYLPGKAGWDSQPTPTAVEHFLTQPPPAARLWNIPGMNVVTWLTDNHTAILRTPNGQARIKHRRNAGTDEYAYLPDPDDIFAYTSDPDLAAFINAGYHPTQAWLAATAHTTCPNIVPQIIPLLRQPRAGQVVMFPQPGYSFIAEHGGHGGLHRDEMLMTFMLHGPGIEPGGVIPHARAVDLVPTVLDLLHVRQDQQLCLSGNSLLSTTQVATEAASAEPRQ